MSVCNLFKSIPAAESVFYTFSEYTNDLPLIKSDNSVSVEPSGFVCLNLSKTTNLNSELQNYYENLCCCERDNSTDKDYKNYLLGGLLGMLKDKEFISSYDNVIYKDNIIHSDGTLRTDDNMLYDEILCYLEPSDKDDQKIILDPDDTKTFNNNDSKKAYLRGYYEVKAISDEYQGEFEFMKASFSSTTSSASDISFNCVIVLYDVTYGDNSEYTNIPLGIYINNPTEGSIKKYIKSDDDIYGQGTSYSLRVCMRYANTIDGDVIGSETITNTDTDSGILPLIDSFNSTMGKMNELTNKIAEYKADIEDDINANLVIDNLLSANITSNGVTLTLQEWIDRISSITETA